MSDRLLTVAIILLVLSMVCERVANFLKLWLSDGRLFNNLRLRENTRDCEKQRELRIQGLSVLCGLLVAVGFGADFNHILGHAGDAIASANDKPSAAVSISLLSNYLWNPISETGRAYWSELGSRVGGTLLVGVFISFGSKFWHDLVDLLLETKNLRGKLADQTTYQVESTQQLEAQLAKRSQGALQDKSLQISTVLEQNRAALLAIPGVISAGIGQQTVNGQSSPCITLMLSPDADPSAIPALSYRRPGEPDEPIPVKLLTSSRAYAMAEVTITPGSRIGNADVVVTSTQTQVAYGSLCFPVYMREDSKRETKLLLTCYHVLRYVSPSYSHPWEEFMPANGYNQVLLYGGNNIVAKLIKGLRSDTLDVALAEVLKGVDLLNTFPGQTWQVRKERWLSYSDHDTTRVRMLGGRSGVKEGVVRELNTGLLVYYANEPDPFALHGLIAVSDDSGQHAISQSGDSGSLLLDEQGYALGIVVAGTNNRTYAIPLPYIFNQLHLTF